MNKLFGLEIYDKSKTELINEIIERDIGNRKTHIISGNAEVLKAPIKQDETFKMFNSDRNIIIPDGISVYLPMKKKRLKTAERITGIDLMQDLLEYYEKNEKSVYFLGAKQEVLEQMILNIKNKYPDLKIAGFHHGYIDINNCSEILDSINISHALFVAMGTPVQEDFIFKYIDELDCKMFMGVGGSFDVLSGYIPRCPEWIRNIGFEWLYRISKDYRKIGRLYNNVVFTLKACFEK